MRNIEEYKQPPTEYILIDYANRRPLYYQKAHLTKYEAHDLNQGFALNGITKRYVKTNGEFNTNKEE